MPLNKPQMEFIEASIAHYFDYDHKTLLSHVPNFCIAFNNAFADNDSFANEEKIDEIFADFSRLIANPAEHLPTLERYNQDNVIYENEIKKFLFYYTINHLSHCFFAPPASEYNSQKAFEQFAQKNFKFETWLSTQFCLKTFKNSGWDLLETLALLNKFSLTDTEIFSSKMSQKANLRLGEESMGVGSNDWSLPIEPYRIYRPFIEVREQRESKEGKVYNINIFLDLHIRFEYTDEDLILKNFRPFPSSGDNNRNDELQSQIKEEAPFIAETAAIKHTFDFIRDLPPDLLPSPTTSLFDTDFLDLEKQEESKIQFSANDPGMRLLVCKYYYDRLIEKKQFFGEELNPASNELNKIKELSLDFVNLHFLENQIDNPKYEFSPTTLRNEVEALCDPDVIKLQEIFSHQLREKVTLMNQHNLKMAEEELSAEITHFENAKKLSTGALFLIRSPYFFNELLERRLSFADLGILDENKNHDEEKGRCIALPIMTRLLVKGIYTFEHLKKMPLSALYILKIPQYGDMALRDKRLASFFNDINTFQASILEDERILRLIVSEKLSLLAAKHMSKATYRILHNTYFNHGILRDQFKANIFENALERRARLLLTTPAIKLIDSDILSAENLLSLNSTDSKALCTPHINEALLASEITARQVLSFSAKQKDLFENEFYYKLFHRKKISYEFIAALKDECINYLLKPELLSLAKKGILEPRHIQFLNEAQLQRLLLKNIYYVLDHRFLNVEEIISLSNDTINILDANLMCCNSVALEITKQRQKTPFNTQEITTYTWAFIMYERLKNIFLEVPPADPENPDTIKKVSADLVNVAEREGILHHHLLAKSLLPFLNFLRVILNEYTANISDAYAPILYTQIKNYLGLLPDEPTDDSCIYLFAEIITVAIKYLQNPFLPQYEHQQFSLFFNLPPTLTFQGVANFCHKMVSFADLIIPTQEEEPSLQTQLSA